MGAMFQFETFVAPTKEKAIEIHNRAVQRAIMEYGNDPYSGTVALSNSLVILDDDVKDDDYARKAIEKSATDKNITYMCRVKASDRWCVGGYYCY